MAAETNGFIRYGEESMTAVRTLHIIDITIMEVVALRYATNGKTMRIFGLGPWQMVMTLRPPEVLVPLIA